MLILSMMNVAKTEVVPQPLSLQEPAMNLQKAGIPVPLCQLQCRKGQSWGAERHRQPYSLFGMGSHVEGRSMSIPMS